MLFLPSSPVDRANLAHHRQREHLPHRGPTTSLHVHYMRSVVRLVGLVSLVAGVPVAAQGAPCPPDCPSAAPAALTPADSVGSPSADPADTVRRKRVRSVELSEWYNRRLTP